LKYHQTIQHVSTNFEQRKGVQPTISNLTLDPRTKALVISGRSGHVQFFSVEKQEYLFQVIPPLKLFALEICNLFFKVDVVAQNYLNQERNIELVNTEVVHTAMSADGNWLATVEERDDGVTHVECRIKFWKWHWQEMLVASS
jgi:NET1-associated nuclear protein 1 (U3 small nucleolar RNA-associated protein 17)